MRLWKEIEVAQNKIQKAIRMTPMIYSEIFSKLTGKEVFLKLENLQKTGSFKIRGAYYKLSRLDPSMKRRGVVAASAGNHAQGVAFASSLLGIQSTIVMPEGSSLAKQMATRSYGGEVILFGRDTDEALGYAKKLTKDGKSLIHPFDDAADHCRARNDRSGNLGGGSRSRGHHDPYWRRRSDLRNRHDCKKEKT